MSEQVKCRYCGDSGIIMAIKRGYFQAPHAFRCHECDQAKKTAAGIPIWKQNFFQNFVPEFWDHDLRNPETL